MADELEVPDPADPTPDPAPDADPLAQARDDGKGNQVVSLKALQAERSERQRLAARVKELEPVAARVVEVNERLTRAQPVIDAIVNNPKLRAEAIRISEGTRPSHETTEQPVDDEDASGFAEEMGFYLGDGVTPDAARGRRVLNRTSGVARKETEAMIRPLAGATLGSRAERNLEAAIAMRDDNGAPVATEQSIRESVAKIPQHLLASGEVIDMILDLAAGKDRRAGRSPKQPDEPLYLESQGGSRRRAATLTTEERRSLERLGLTDKEYADAGEKLSTGRSIILGR